MAISADVTWLHTVARARGLRFDDKSTHHAYTGTPGPDAKPDLLSASLKNVGGALAGVAQLPGHCPVH